MKSFSPCLDSEKIEFTGTSIDETHNHPSSRAERWMYEGSGWTTFSILQHQVFISLIALFEKCFYFPLPDELRNAMKRLIILNAKIKTTLDSA